MSDDKEKMPRKDDPRSGPGGEASSTSERIAKRLARAGIASRREAEAMIAAGRVSVNGKILASPAINVGQGDRIEVDGAALPAIERTRLFLFHKPAGVMTTNRDPEGRRTVFDVLPDGLPRLVTVGRLDLSTEGLLLMTNDGGLARVLELPSTGWLRRYRVRVHGKVDLQALEGLKEGIAVDGVFYGAIEAALDRVQGTNAWLTIGLREGKNREVRNVLGALNLDVTRLIRISYGPFQLADLAEGTVREIKGRTLRDQLGERLIREAGADFDAPVAIPFTDQAKRAADAERGPGKPAEESRREPPAGKRAERPDRPGRPDRPDRQQKRDAALERLDTRAGRHSKPAAQKRDEPLRRRAVNVWMAPGARPMGKKTAEDDAAGEETRKARPHGGADRRPKPDGKPRKASSSGPSERFPAKGEKRHARPAGPASRTDGTRGAAAPGRGERGPRADTGGGGAGKPKGASKGARPARPGASAPRTGENKGTPAAAPWRAERAPRAGTGGAGAGKPKGANKGGRPARPASPRGKAPRKGPKA